MQVRIKSTLGLVIGVRYIVSYPRPFSSNVTNFCHDILYRIMIDSFQLSLQISEDLIKYQKASAKLFNKSLQGKFLILIPYYKSLLLYLPSGLKVHKIS